MRDFHRKVERKMKVGVRKPQHACVCVYLFFQQMSTHARLDGSHGWLTVIRSKSIISGVRFGPVKHQLDLRYCKHRH